MQQFEFSLNFIIILLNPKVTPNGHAGTHQRGPPFFSLQFERQPLKKFIVASLFKHQSDHSLGDIIFYKIIAAISRF
jgi:hypothetical protein